MRSFLRILCAILFCFNLAESFAQCSTGYTTAAINWDAIDYIPTSGYSNTEAIALSPRQNFAFGKNRMNITYSTCTSTGENALHTGESGSYGVGEDVQFSGNGTVTISFTTAVMNVKFSVYDIDKGQVIAFTAANSGVATPVTVTKTNSASTIISISGSTVTSTTGSESDASNNNSVNIDIAGPVTSVTMVITNTNSVNGGSADPNYWLSDIAACTLGSFPNNYYNVSRPFGTQPGYVLVAANKGVYMVDPATGNAKFIFTDGATSGTINSVAYDPYNKIIYYCWSLTNNGTANASERTLRKYDFNTKTTTVLLNDIRSLGIPTFDQGVESGAAAFYDGALYIGIEGGADNTGGGPRTNTNKESIIWRIDFDANQVPLMATQVYAVSGDTHDWSDFSISDGLLVDLNGDASTPDYHHLNMQSGAKTRVPHVSVTPKQSAVGWDGKFYWVSNSIAQYNMAGGLGTQYAITANPAIPNWSNSSSPSFGDAAEAFRPQADFGDAPATYDPNPLAPALHEENANLKFGTKLGVEWNKMSTTNTDDDDDGLYFVPILNQGGGVYQTYVKVFNNTGAPATVGGWMDFNGDGIYQEEEGVLTTVQTGTTEQMVSLYWTGIAYNMPNNSSTYLRIRITSATNTMTRSSATGYFANGEVEDWSVLVNTTTLKGDLKSFTAEKSGVRKAKLNWNVTDETQNTVYELQRSADGINWNTIHVKEPISRSQKASYSFTDLTPAQPLSYYRLKYFEKGDAAKYSNIQQVQFKSANVFNLFPNPAFDQVSITVESANEEVVQLYVINANGKAVSSQSLKLKKGSNSYSLPVYHFVDGVYYVQVYTSDQQHVQKLIIKKK